LREKEAIQENSAKSENFTTTRKKNPEGGKVKRRPKGLKGRIVRGTARREA